MIHEKAMFHVCRTTVVIFRTVSNNFQNGILSNYGVGGPIGTSTGSYLSNDGVGGPIGTSAGSYLSTDDVGGPIGTSVGSYLSNDGVGGPIGTSTGSYYVLLLNSKNYIWQHG